MEKPRKQEESYEHDMDDSVEDSATTEPNDLHRNMDDDDDFADDWISHVDDYDNDDVNNW